MASVTINTTPAQDARLAPAFGALLGLTQPGTNTLQNATVAQVKQNLIEYMTNVVRNYEERQQVASLIPPIPITPT